MELVVKKKLSNGLVEINIDEKSEKEALARALFYLQPDYCGLCKKDNVIWTSNKAKDKNGDMFTYIKRVCLNKECKAQSTAGEYKDGGLFWKQWEIWEGEKADSGGKGTKDSAPSVDEEDIPM